LAAQYHDPSLVAPPGGKPGLFSPLRSEAAASVFLRFKAMNKSELIETIAAIMQAAIARDNDTCILDPHMTAGDVYDQIPITAFGSDADFDDFEQLVIFAAHDCYHASLESESA
jgi:hypothetical protein